MHLKSFTRKLRLLTIIFPLIVLAGCWGNGSGPSSTSDGKASPPPTFVEVLKNGDFEAGDASAGEIIGTPPDWSDSFNDVAVISSLCDECQDVPVPLSPDQVLKMFGPFIPEGAAGTFQLVEASPGRVYTASAWANNSSVDPLQDKNLADLQLTFLDGFKNEIETKEILAGVEDLPMDTWVKLKVSAIAPSRAAYARIQLLHIQLNDPATGGAIFWDDASLLESADDFKLIWSDEFDDWCGEGICSPDPNNWTIETGYGEFGWGNNEWQLYTEDLDNVRVENGNLVISAFCGSAPEGYFQDFEGLNAAAPNALSDAGFVYFADVWGKADGSDAEVGVDIFLYAYGPAGAPNGGPGFSAVAGGEGDVNQGAQYLNVYSDYNNLDQAAGGSCGQVNSCTINTSVFQESTIGPDEIGETYTFTFDAKSPFKDGIFDAGLDNGDNIAKPTSASAFIKTLDQSAGFATTNDIRVDMTNISNEEWATFSISLDLTDPLLEGQLLQFGFNTVTTAYDNTGVYYDNISFKSDVIGPPEECVAGVRDGSVTSGRINTLGKKDDIRYGKIEARIKPAVGKGAWPAFWMLGSNFPDIGWPRSGEIDIMEMWNTGVSNPMTAHSTLHWCDETIQAPDECSFPEGRVFEGGSFEFDSSLGNDFHKFTAIWDPDKIVFFVDNIEIFSRVIEADTMEEFTRDFFMILNVAMGGTLGSGGQPPDGTEVWPQTMLVDWVRVYEAVQ